MMSSLHNLYYRCIKLARACYTHGACKQKTSDLFQWAIPKWNITASEKDALCFNTDATGSLRVTSSETWNQYTHDISCQAG